MDEFINQEQPIVELIPEVLPKKKLPILMILFLFVIVILFLIIFRQQQLLKTNKQPEIVNNIVPIAEPTQVPTVPPTSIPTENNKYTFNNLSFELPPGYTVSTDTANSNANYIDIIKKDIQNTYLTTGIKISTMQGMNNFSMTLKFAEEKCTENPNNAVISKEIVEIGNKIKANKITFGGMTYNEIEYCFVKEPNFFYTIMTSTDNRYQDVRNKIFETLKIN